MRTKLLPMKADRQFPRRALVGVDANGLAVLATNTPETVRIAGVVYRPASNRERPDGSADPFWRPERVVEVAIGGGVYDFAFVGTPRPGAPAFLVDSGTVSTQDERVEGARLVGAFVEPEVFGGRWFVEIEDTDPESRLYGRAAASRVRL